MLAEVKVTTKSIDSPTLRIPADGSMPIHEDKLAIKSAALP